MKRLGTASLAVYLAVAARSLRLAHGAFFPVSRLVVIGSSIAVAGLGLVIPRLQQKQQVIYTPQPGSLAGQVILITGGTTGLGLESAKRLAVSGARVVLTSRTREKGEAALGDIATYLQQQGLKNDNVSYKILQLDDLNEIRSAVETWDDIETVDVLMLNAGVMACRQREITTDGFERQIQTNHLGHFLLAALLSPRLPSNARIIAVSSAAYKLSALSGLDLDYIWTADKYSPWKSYSQSKLANILFVQELRRRVEQAGMNWMVVALHPGSVATGIGRHFFIGNDNYERMIRGDATIGLPMKCWVSLMSAVIKTPEQGASTQIWLASADSARLQSVSASYFSGVGGAERLFPAATDPSAATRLWEQSEIMGNVSFSPRSALLRSINQ